jgi:hypothetical protein
MVIKNKSFFDLYHDSLDKLLDQESDLLIKRIEYAKQGNWSKVAEIEKKYLDPLQKKINKLARIAKEEVEHEG